MAFLKIIWPNFIFCANTLHKNKKQIHLICGSQGVKTKICKLSFNSFFWKFCSKVKFSHPSLVWTIKTKLLWSHLFKIYWKDWQIWSIQNWENPNIRNTLTSFFQNGVQIAVQMCQIYKLRKPNEVVSIQLCRCDLFQ